MRPAILCVDVGTSSMKGGLFTEEGKLLQLLRAPLLETPRENFQQFDPQRWEKAFHALLKEISVSSPSSIVFSGQGPTLVPLDDQGNPTYPALHWMDGRELPIPQGKSLFLPKVSWFKQMHPEEFEKTKVFLSCPEYLIYRLSGEAITCSPSSEFDPYYWEEEECKKRGLDPSLFPPFVRSATCIGRIHKGQALYYGLSPSTKIYTAGPDYLMSLVGTATIREGRTCDRAGTSEGINRCITKLVTYPGLRSLPHLIPGLYTIAGMLTHSGRLFEWFRELTNQRNTPYEIMMKEISSLSMHALQMRSPLPSFFPFIRPDQIWDFDKGMFVGFGTEQGRIDLGYAVVEAIGFAVRAMVERIEEAGYPIDVLRLSGGQANNAIWNQMKADIVGKPLLIPEVKDAELMGGFIMYKLAESGRGDVEQIAETLVHFQETLEPQYHRASFYCERFEQYKTQCQRFIAAL
ncbi:MAG: FGGY-family carbohydrate kinase [Spirochaetales bacterium]